MAVRGRGSGLQGGESATSAWAPSTPNDVNGMPSSTKRLLERPRCRGVVRLEQQLDAVQIARRRRSASDTGPSERRASW